jgi:hypothetical protein
MSFWFTVAGKIGDVKHQLDHLEPPSGDPSQFEAARALVRAELDAWPSPAYYNYVLAEASGHHDTTSGRSLSIDIRPLKIVGADSEAAAGAAEG